MSSCWNKDADTNVAGNKMKKFQDKIKNDGKNKNDLKEKFLEVEIFFCCVFMCVKIGF